MRQFFICLTFIFASPYANAEWQILEGSTKNLAQYIDLEKVKQMGPMAIYRQLPVLSQGGAVAANDTLSTLALYEYDCMNAKFRVLQTIGFSEQWAQGEKSISPSDPESYSWQSLPLNPLGQQMFNLLCPSGNDN